MTQTDFEFFKERGFGKGIGIGKKPCLIVIDMINGFTDENMPMGSNLDQEIENINKVIQLARTTDIPVIFTTISYSDGLLERKLVWRMKMDGLNTLKAGTPAVEVDSRLDFRAHDDLLTKKHASSFYGTDLVSLLTASDIDTLIVTGATTSGCIKSTVVDAVQNGYKAVVVKDAVGDRSEASHQQSLFDIEQKYGDGIMTEDLIEVLTEKTLKQ